MASAHCFFVAGREGAVADLISVAAGWAAVVDFAAAAGFVAFAAGLTVAAVASAGWVVAIVFAVPVFDPFLSDAFSCLLFRDSSD